MIRKCTDYGKIWEDDGDYLCQFCGSENTYVFAGSESPEMDLGKGDNV